jgi:nucleoside-diphosphate-sugar epimerase
MGTMGRACAPTTAAWCRISSCQALAGQALTVYGDGSQTRSLCYVGDMIDAFLLLMDAPDGVCDPVNLGNPHEISMRELAERIARLAGSSSRVEFRPLLHGASGPRRHRRALRDRNGGLHAHGGDIVGAHTELGVELVRMDDIVALCQRA